MLRSVAAGGGAPAAYQNYYYGIGRGTSGGAVHGFVGVMMHSALLAALPGTGDMAGRCSRKAWRICERELSMAL